MQRYLRTVPAGIQDKGQETRGLAPLPLLRESRIHEPPPPSPGSQSQVWKSTSGSWKERPFRNIGNSTGKCHYILSGGCLRCLKGSHSSAEVKTVAKINTGASERQRDTHVCLHSHVCTACTLTDRDRHGRQNHSTSAKADASLPADPTLGGGGDPISWCWD